MKNCKNCKFRNKKKVAAPSGAGMCENRLSTNHKMVLDNAYGCDKFKKGKFSKKYIIYLTQ